MKAKDLINKISSLKEFNEKIYLLNSIKLDNFKENEDTKKITFTTYMKFYEITLDKNGKYKSNIKNINILYNNYIEKFKNSNISNYYSKSELSSDKTIVVKEIDDILINSIICLNDNAFDRLNRRIYNIMTIFKSHYDKKIKKIEIDFKNNEYVVKLNGRKNEELKNLFESFTIPEFMQITFGSYPSYFLRDGKFADFILERNQRDPLTITLKDKSVNNNKNIAFNLIKGLSSNSSYPYDLINKVIFSNKFVGMEIKDRKPNIELSLNKRIRITGNLPKEEYNMHNECDKFLKRMKEGRIA